MAKWQTDRAPTASAFIGGFRSKLDRDFESIIDVGWFLGWLVGCGATPSSHPCCTIPGERHTILALLHTIDDDSSTDRSVRLHLFLRVLQSRSREHPISFFRPSEKWKHQRSLTRFIAAVAAVAAAVACLASGSEKRE